jgi:hypothetical protein
MSHVRIDKLIYITRLTKLIILELILNELIDTTLPPTRQTELVAQICILSPLFILLQKEVT